MKSLILSLMEGDQPSSPELGITPISEAVSTETAERRKLVAYCNFCEAWWKFVRDMSPTAEEEVCPDCGGRPSNRVGFQITTQRTFNPNAKKLSKAAQKKLGMGA